MNLDGYFLRIEDADGLGPYRSRYRGYLDNIIEENIMDGMCDPGKHPAPGRDARLVESTPEEFWTTSFFHQYSFLSTGYIFGFNSVEQMWKWFDSEIFFLAFAECEFRVVVYSGEFFAGDTQGIIKESTKTAITSFDPVEFYDKFIPQS